MSVSVKVNCFHSGRFKEEGGLCYVGGAVDEFELDADSLFTNLVMKMFEKSIVLGKLWFKLPFHDLEDKKPLWENVEANKKRMESAARWYKELDVYVERDRDVLAEEDNRNVRVQDEGMNVVPEEEDEDESLDPLYDPLAEESDDGRCSEKRRRLSKKCQEDAQEAAATNAQDEANDEAQEAAEMEADLAAQMEDQVEVEFISSTAPQPSQPSQGNQAPQRNLRRSSRLASLLFG
ncbi:hypothetical protein Bca101_064831 [Brassica carinata]